MKKPTLKNWCDISWCFALVNNRLAEIYFKSKNGKSDIQAHCYIKREEFKTKSELKMIDSDTKKYQFTWKNKIYKKW